MLLRWYDQVCQLSWLVHLFHCAGSQDSALHRAHIRISHSVAHSSLLVLQIPKDEIECCGPVVGHWWALGLTGYIFACLEEGVEEGCWQLSRA